ncbi:MAG: glutamate formiminotransferase [Acidimicrobiales bacterium]
MSGGRAPLECVINASEGRSSTVIDALVVAAGTTVLDVHSDPEHNRTVLTLGGAPEAVEQAARDVVGAAVDLIDLRAHHGIHPRLGVADVVPFVPTAGKGTAGASWERALGARRRFAEWAGTFLSLPCFLYGPERSLPEVRRSAFATLWPDTGPRVANPTAGATAVGARPVLVAYNVWLTGVGGRAPLAAAKEIAAELRGPTVRSLGLPVEVGAQVSFNLVDPLSTTLTEVVDAVAVRASARGCAVLRSELVGLVPDAVLRAVPRNRWSELDIDEDRTIEGRLEAAGRPAR